MQFLCFLGFCVLWFVQWLGHLLPPVFYWLQGFMCVCAQVSCSVVCNWSLCDLFVDMCILICLGFNLLSIIFNFFNFVFSWDTRRWIKSKNIIRLIHVLCLWEVSSWLLKTISMRRVVSGDKKSPQTIHAIGRTHGLSFTLSQWNALCSVYVND
jgi:hypothetical protein